MSCPRFHYVVEHVRRSVIYLLLLSSGVAAQSIVTPWDTIPDFVARPTIVSRTSGPWSDPGTWLPNRVPVNEDVVVIQAGHEVTYDVVSNAALAALGIDGTLRFRTHASTRLVVGTVLVKPTGRLEIGTLEQPVAVGAVAELVIANRRLATTAPDPATGVLDPNQYGTGLIVLGTIVVSGAPKTPTWVRLATAPQAKDTVLSLSALVAGWRPGDRVVVPDTRQLPIDHSKRYSTYYRSQTETTTVTSIDGLSVRLATSLVFAHQGARDPDGTPATSALGEPLLPHVGNLTRNVIIRSADPNGTRGHVLITYRATADLRYATWLDLGRTTTATLGSSNHVGRYWVHLHHLLGQPRAMPAGLTAAEIRTWLEDNGWQFVFVGNAIAASSPTSHSRKWGLVLHDSHFGLVADNVIYNVAGSGIQTEEGQESYNLIARNLAVRITGLGEKKVSSATTSDIGKDGSGFWFRGPHNWMEDNVAADVRFAGHYLSAYYITTQNVPKFPGADPAVDGTPLRLRPLLRFADNEAYGSIQHGLWGAWGLGCCNAGNWPEIKIDRFASWHAWNSQVKWYHNGRTTFTNPVLRGDPKVSAGSAFDGRPLVAIGFALDFYENVDLVIHGADIQGLIQGLYMPRDTVEFGSEPPTLVADSFLQNYINVRIPRPDSGDVTRLLFDNVQLETFNRPSHPLSGVPLHYYMHYNADSDSASATAQTTEVRAYNGVPGDDFRLYFVEEGAPCTVTRPLIVGYVCPP